MTASVIEGFGHERKIEAGPPRAVVADELTFMRPDADVSPWIIGFAYRHDGNCGDVVHELPELRPTIQIMLADDYYLRERGKASDWRPVPRIALWGPRVTWGYGYARQLVRAFGAALSAQGFAALIGRPMGEYVDRVVNLGEIDPALANGMSQIVSAGSPSDWTRQTSDLVRRRLEHLPREADPLDRSLSHLLADEGDAVRRAAGAAGLSERQYRRLFQLRYGLSPRLYRRVLRVDRLMRRLHPAPWERDLHASELNFADQPHMIREFKTLTGVTPGQYARSKRSNGDATIRSLIARSVAPPEF